MGTWKRFWSLDRNDRGVVLEAAAVMVATRAGLRVFGYRRWHSLLAKYSSSRKSDSPAASGLFSITSRLERLTESAARHMVIRPTCLERSVGLWWLLRRRCVEAEIQIGARKEGERFEAHAWVECADGVLGDISGEHEEFTAFGDSSQLAARPR
jgi:transglutaminase superfamily protein